MNQRDLSHVCKLNSMTEAIGIQLSTSATYTRIPMVRHFWKKSGSIIERTVLRGNLIR